MNSNQKNSLNGFLVLDKPSGLTSNAVLQKVKHLTRAAKAGHTGALDPLATGVLPIALGEATKFAQYLLDASKDYEVEATFGEKRTTADAEGDIIETAPLPKLEEESIKKVFDGFIGKIQQTPPIYSALKVRGKKLYEYARAGEEVSINSREVEIFSLTLITLCPQSTKVRFRVHCSKGTYVRTLVEDISAALGTLGFVSKLRRTQSGPYTLGQALSLEELSKLMKQDVFSEGLRSQLMPLDSALGPLPTQTLSDQQLQALIHGLSLEWPVQAELEAVNPSPHQSNNKNPQSLVKLYRLQCGSFIGTGEHNQKVCRLKVKRLLSNTLLASLTQNTLQ